MPHYITTSGSRGCLPDNCEAFDYFEDAVSYLSELFDLGYAEEEQLRTDKYLELDHAKYGAEYCDIEWCDCGNISIHQDGVD
jgi:hypothetical protein